MIETALIPSIIILFNVVVITLIYKIYRVKKDMIQMEVDFDKEKSKIRRDAKFRSASVNWGLSIENFVPFMDHFPIPAEAINFLGKPIDYVGFTDTEDKLKCKVHIIEVKSGKSQLSAHQRNIRDAVRAGRVEWHEVRVKGNAKREQETPD
jgi:predicted Holliday junction resolvase-like endonuclease